MPPEHESVNKAEAARIACPFFPGSGRLESLASRGYGARLIVTTHLPPPASQPSGSPL